MAQYAGLVWVILLGPPETNRRKPFCFNGRLPVAQLICFEALLVSLGASTQIFFVGASLCERLLLCWKGWTGTSPG